MVARRLRHSLYLEEKNWRRRSIKNHLTASSARGHHEKEGRKNERMKESCAVSGTPSYGAARIERQGWREQYEWIHTLRTLHVDVCGNDDDDARRFKDAYELRRHEWMDEWMDGCMNGWVHGMIS